MIQSFRAIKRDVNDDLFSKIIRHGHTRCLRCQKNKSLQTAHIFSRRFYPTRFQYEPVKAAVPLCADCHSWMDGAKDDTPIFNEDIRKYLKVDKNAFKFLVENCGYKWADLQKLYFQSHSRMNIKYIYIKKELTKNLREHLKKLEKP